MYSPPWPLGWPADPSVDKDETALLCIVAHWTSNVPLSIYRLNILMGGKRGSPEGMRNVVDRLRSRGLVAWAKRGRSYDLMPTPSGLLRAHADLTSYRLGNPNGPIEGVDSLLFVLSHLLGEIYGKAMSITERRIAEGAKLAGQLRQHCPIRGKPFPRSRPQYFKRTDATRQVLLETRVAVPYFFWDDKQRGGSKSLKNIVNETRLSIAKSIGRHEMRFPYLVPKHMRTIKPSSNPLLKLLLKKASKGHPT